MPTNRKKVLVITYYFPPAGGVAVQRTLKYVKYLREFGWEPVVLTARCADYPVYDESLFSEIPEGVKVYRSLIFEPYKIYRRFTGRKADESTDIATLTLDEPTKNKFSERISEWIRSCFFVPDARIGWLFFATFLGKKILKDEKIDLIYSSATPYTTHLIGLKLRRFSKLKWVADFRDSWIGWHQTPQWRPGISNKIEYKMEGAVLQEADCVITASEGIKNDLLSRHSDLHEKKWVVITNGFDAEDFLGLEAMPGVNKLTITYTGSLDGVRNPECFISALENLSKEFEDLTENLHVRFVGRIGEPIVKRIEGSCVNSIFEMIPFVSHFDSLRYMLASDVLLILVDAADVNRAMISAKLFEYVGAGGTILAIAPQGDLTELICNNNLGFTVCPKNIAGIKSILQQLLKLFKSGGKFKPFDEQVANKFGRKGLTAKLSSVFNDLCQQA